MNQVFKNLTRRPRSVRQQGFTLVELLVGMTVGLFLTLGTYLL